MYDGYGCQVLHNGQLSPFPVTNGVRQGCILSPVIFIMVLDDIMGTTTKDVARSIRWNLTERLEDLDYADDISLLSQCLRKILNIYWPMIISNENLWRLTEEEPIEIQIKRRKLRWIGHTLWKPNEAIERQALEWNPQGARKLYSHSGHPRKLFSESSKKTKRRKTEHLREAADPAALALATKISLKASGKKNQLNLILQSLRTLRPKLWRMCGERGREIIPPRQRTDLNQGRSAILLTVPQLKVLSTYNVSGQILLLPITGTGNINITLVDAKCMVRYDFTIEKINGVDRIQLTSATVHLDPKRMYINSTTSSTVTSVSKRPKAAQPLQLQRGEQKQVGETGMRRRQTDSDQMNKLLDENWKEVFDEITPHIAGSFLEMFIKLANEYSNNDHKENQRVLCLTVSQA
ncbi:hypothetical protein ANN_10255 [Periplaneta americana]|uniref:Reverse transcriptase domain-containing protein n=1 Tax=Periplaneta americana TaxID=6978 RepID=A0ABQ8TNI8_PERAM|nr:hypothetical protein ANN_10255 [Periplaneta americana]